MILLKPEFAKKVPWKLEEIRFLYSPDDFVGNFSNEKMQARHQRMQEEKINALLDGLAREKNPAAAMRVLHRRDQIRFFCNNLEEFRAENCLEKTLLDLYYRDNTPFSAGGDYSLWQSLFRECDRERIAGQGEQPPTNRVTVYRGSVTGVVRGFSWTLSREKTAWFLERWQDKEEGGGIIFALEVSPADILVYLKEKEEVLLLPDLVETLPGTRIEALP